MVHICLPLWLHVLFWVHEYLDSGSYIYICKMFESAMTVYITYLILLQQQQKSFKYGVGWAVLTLVKQN